MIYESDYFKRNEFACKCGHCGHDVVDYELLQVLDYIRGYVLNAPVKVNSGNRCVVYNQKVGGARRSQHLLGKAADLDISNFADQDLIVEEFNALWPDKYGLILYDNFIHVDVRGKKYRGNRRSFL